MSPSTRRPRHANLYARPRMDDDLHRARTDEHQELLPASHMDADLNAASGAERTAVGEDDDEEEELPDSNPEDPSHDLEEVEEEEEEEEEEQDQDQEEDSSLPSTPLSPSPSPQPQDDDDPHPFPPPGLKEISSLASWTVSTAKPGNGVSALRHPSNTQFWQSDGPQPHTLNIHFFKLVSIHRMRIYLDFLSDESYTPTKIQFLAGMGSHDLIDFAEMSLEQPTGWIDVDFHNVGGAASSSFSSSSSSSFSKNDVIDSEDWNDDDDDDDENDPTHRNYWNKQPVLRAFLVQVRILENHQNGKDTHLRAVQIFARDDEGVKKEMRGGGKAVAATAVVKKNEKGNVSKRVSKKEANNIELADWMMNPDIR